MTDVGTNGGATGIQLPKIRYTTAIPDSARGRGRPGQGENPYQKLMIDMPAPAPGKGKGAPMQFASFFVATEVSDTITDPDERAKAAKDGTAKLVNRFTSVSRRIRKNLGATHDYTFRKAQDPDGSGAWGVVVYRIVPGAVKGPAKAS